MSDNPPLQNIFQKMGNVATEIRTQFCWLFDKAIHPSPLLSLSSPGPTPLNNNNGGSSFSRTQDFLLEDKAAHPVTKEDLGRATWTFLHTLGAQYPDKPTRQQRKDVKELMAIVSRMYPCKECADHFKEVLSLSKPIFPCERVDARWGKLDCEKRTCDLQGHTSFGDDSY